ncbi:MAG: NTP transferase domain-containing protein, partial [Nitrospinae bacterium]|nr:NTP transferase domain-containing protein [Nitrospinota bacterium]
MIFAVIMAGGSGTRFWPLSKSRTPKQLLNLTGDNTLIQKTINRIKPIIKNKNIFIVTGNSHVKKMREQIKDVPPENIINEPFGRNTAPCIGLAAIHIKRRDPDGVMVVLPADHIIKDE